MIPILILQTWLLGLLSLGLVAGVVFAAREWQDRSWGWDPVRAQSVFSPDLGWNEDTAILALAVGLAFVVLFGGSLVKGLIRLFRRGGAVTDVAAPPTPVSTHVIQRPDDSKLHVECFGREDGIPIVLTHGWTLDSTEWKYFITAMAGRFRLIVWDEPGLGRSTRPADRNYSLENLAGHLQAVLALAGGQPAILLGHSIGGMIMLTFCKLFPGELGKRVMGLVLTHTTPTNPVRTTSGAGFYSAIQKPVLVPLMHLTIALSPLVWVLNWLSYRNGSAHLSVMRGSFAGTETWEQIEFAARFQVKASPAVVARGMLGMMRYDAADTIASIHVPTLIVAGDQDATTKPQASDWIESAISTSQRVTLAPAKHLGLIEHNDLYADAVRTFVSRCEAERTKSGELPAWSPAQEVTF